MGGGGREVQYALFSRAHYFPDILGIPCFFRAQWLVRLVNYEFDFTSLLNNLC